MTGSQLIWGLAVACLLYILWPTLHLALWRLPRAKFKQANAAARLAEAEAELARTKEKVTRGKTESREILGDICDATLLGHKEELNQQAADALANLIRAGYADDALNLMEATKKGHYIMDLFDIEQFRAMARNAKEGKPLLSPEVSRYMARWADSKERKQ